MAIHGIASMISQFVTPHFTTKSIFLKDVYMKVKKLKLHFSINFDFFLALVSAVNELVAL